MLVQSLEIIRLRASQRTTFLLFRLHASTGRSGLGEATMGGDDATKAAAARRLFEGCLAGRPVADHDTLTAELKAALGPHPPIAHATACSALEQALWDLRGQQEGVPVYALLGDRQREHVTLYANINRGTLDRTPAGFAARAQQAAAQGFQAIKCAPFDQVEPQRLHEPAVRAAIELGIERVAAVRAAIGPQVALMVDCHNRFDSQTALAIAERLAPFDLRWFEEPVRAHAGLAEVGGRCTLPLAGGESLYGLQQFAELLDRVPLRFVMPDVKHCGGVGELWRIGAMARERGVAVAPHNPSGPLATLASAHVGIALPTFDLLEYQWNEVPWAAELLDPPEQIVAGRLAVADRPGLGVRLNEAVVRKHTIALDAT